MLLKLARFSYIISLQLYYCYVKNNNQKIINCEMFLASRFDFLFSLSPSIR